MKAWGLLLIGLCARAGADEAILTDGRKVRGKLTLKDREWSFSPADSKIDRTNASLQRVHLDPTEHTPLQAGLVMRLEMVGNQQITGRLVAFGAQWVKVRTAWGADIDVARPAVLAVRNVPGRMPVFLDDFETDLKGWQTTGKPTLARNGTNGDSCLSLNAVGQAVEHHLQRPIAEGWIGINFRPEDEPTGGLWTVEATFQTKTGPRAVLVHLAGEGEDYTVSAPGVSGNPVRVVRARGWRRLGIRFAPTSLRISVDDSPIWHSQDNGPGGPLVACKISCAAIQGKSLRGAVLLDECAIYQDDAAPRRPSGDPGQDEVCLASGDQVFGNMLRLHSGGALLAGQPNRTFPWTTMRAVYPSKRNVALPARPADAVRLEFDAGIDADPDVIDGVVTRWDDKRMSFRNPLLDGERTVDRGRLRSIQWVRP